MHNLYQEILMDHYKNPRNRGRFEQYSFIAQQRNSSCGDEITCYGIIQDGILSDVRFDGKGCVISQACASLLSERIKGKLMQEINALDAQFIVSMIGMPLGPVRMQCALLPLTALQSNIHKN